MRNRQEEIQWRESGGQLHREIESLSPDRRKAVRAHRAGFGVREIMELQYWPYHRARNLIARGMADLRRGLRKRGVDV